MGLGLVAVCLLFVGTFVFAFTWSEPSPRAALQGVDEGNSRPPAASTDGPREVVAAEGRREARGAGATFDCSSPVVTDGDTIRCGDRRVRLASIDAPELPGHCRPGRDCTAGDPFGSTASLVRLVATGPLTCVETDRDRYGRTVARCSAGGVDVSCAQVAAGHAVERYGRLDCEGAQ